MEGETQETAEDVIAKKLVPEIERAQNALPGCPVRTEGSNDGSKGTLKVVVACDPDQTVEAVSQNPNTVIGNTLKMMIENGQSCTVEAGARLDTDKEAQTYKVTPISSFKCQPAP